MITFNGVSLDTYSAKVFRIDTDTVPARVMDSYEINGRSGDLLYDRKRYKNVPMLYRVVLYGANAESNFNELKNFLMSQIGYKRLTDTEHPNEFYLAYVSSDIEPEITKTRDKIKFELEFTRKPQRYYVSGETETVIGFGGSDTVRGKDLVLIGSLIDASVAKLYIVYTPQSGTPTAPVSMPTKTTPVLFDVRRKFGPPMNYWGPYDGYGSEITVTLPPRTMLPEDCILSGEINLLTGAGTAEYVRAGLPKTGWSYSSGVLRNSIFLPEISTIVACTHYRPGSSVGVLTNDTVWFDNGVLCVYDSRFSSAAAFESYLATEDIYLAGEPSVTVSLAIDPYTPNFPVEDTNIVVSFNDEIEFGYTPTGDFYNPTYMLASPLISAKVNSLTGGSFTINGDTVTIDSGVSDVVIDSEMQDCYYGSTNLNDKVSFAPSYDFPVLNPGENVISASAGITQLVIKPRWWSI